MPPPPTPSQTPVKGLRLRLRLKPGAPGSSRPPNLVWPAVPSFCYSRVFQHCCLDLIFNLSRVVCMPGLVLFA